MKCLKCGTESTDNLGFCKVCGGKLEETQEVNSVNQQPVVSNEGVQQSTIVIPEPITEQQSAQPTVEPVIETQPVVTPTPVVESAPVVEPVINTTPVVPSVQEPVQPVNTQIPVNNTNTPKKGNSALPIVLILIILIVGAILAWLFVFNKPNNNKKSLGACQVDTSTIDIVESDDFLLYVEDVFVISGRGTVVAGRVLRGEVKVGDELEIVGMGMETKKTTVTYLQAERQSKDVAVAGDNIGIHVDVDRTEVKKGQVLAKPGSIKSTKKFEVSLTLYETEKSKRTEPVVTDNYLGFLAYTIEVVGQVKLDCVNEVKPGDKDIRVTIELEDGEDIPIEVGTKFDVNGSIMINKGKKSVGYRDRIIGEAIVTKILD